MAIRGNESGTQARTTKDDQATRVRTKIHDHLRDLGGRGSLQWAGMQRAHSDLAVHCQPDAVATVSWALLEQLAYQHEAVARAKLTEIELWTTKSKNYSAIDEHLHLLDRTTVTRVPVVFAKKYAACGKLRRRLPTDPPLRAWCSFYSPAEYHKVPPRQRGLFEPHINDIVRRLGLDVSVTYTSRTATREAVLSTNYGIRADMVAWFDELPTPDISEFHGVLVEGDDDDWSLEVLAMGSKSACRIAHTTLELIAPSAERDTPAGQAELLFVDNANLLAQTIDECTAAMHIMKTRATSVGAQLHIESPGGLPEQVYTFLGEHYNHITKERSLPSKHVDKAREMLLFVQARSKGRMTAKQFMCLIGSIGYGTQVLDINLTNSMGLLKEHAEVARDAAHRGTWHHIIAVSTTTITEVARLLQIMIDNKPVHVTRGHAPATAPRTVEVFVDASRWGWGAIVIGAAGNVQHLQKQWTLLEHTNYDTGSSVTTEPLALRQMICNIIEPQTHFIVHSDHEPLVWACHDRRWSSTPQYNDVHRLIRDIETIGASVEIRFVPGDKNPADALSRGQPPSLPVTAIGGLPHALTHTLLLHAQQHSARQGEEGGRMPMGARPRLCHSSSHCAVSR